MGSLLKSVGVGLWQSYNKSLSTNPLITKSFTSFTGFILGDGIAQISSKPLNQYDFKRTARFAAFGFCIHAPGCHYFYRALDAIVFPHAPKSAKAIVAKIVVDQMMWTPISICIFYSVFKTMEGQANKIKQTIKEKFWPTLLAGYAVWPLAHVINFRFVGTHHRVLYINVVQAISFIKVGWNVLLCKIATSGTNDEQSRLKKSDSDPNLHRVEAGLTGRKDGVAEFAGSRR